MWPTRVQAGVTMPSVPDSPATVQSTALSKLKFQVEQFSGFDLIKRCIYVTVLETQVTQCCAHVTHFPLQEVVSLKVPVGGMVRGEPSLLHASSYTNTGR
jgi:hypothetical protein